jgi:hypothetical protein
VITVGSWWRACADTVDTDGWIVVTEIGDITLDTEKHVTSDQSVG